MTEFHFKHGNFELHLKVDAAQLVWVLVQIIVLVGTWHQNLLS